MTDIRRAAIALPFCFLAPMAHGKSAAPEAQQPPNILLSATRLLYHMGKIFQSSAPAPQSCGVQIDRKRLAKLRRMRMAAGHKADDHEQEQTNSTMSMGW